MAAPDLASTYALGYSDSERTRLIRQAGILAPLTDRFFRESGIGAGHRVLDLGSGMGDVAMLLAHIVGPSGEVVGIERDSNSIAVATARIVEAGITNVSFTQSDASQISLQKSFDAVVGRLILQFLSDPVSVLRSLSQSLRPGGVVAFLEPQWEPHLSLLRSLPLSFATACAVRDAFSRSGVRTDAGLSLYSVFQQAGLPPPSMRLEVCLGASSDYVLWIHELFVSLLPKMNQHGISLEKLGDLNTLAARLLDEVAAANTVVPVIPLACAASRLS